MNGSTRLPLLQRIAAFSNDPRGGNPAGVWIGEALPSPDAMQKIAAEVGYSETAFLAALGERSFAVRYFSPAAEVSFCGHATIAAGTLLGEIDGEGRYVLSSAVGDIEVHAERTEEGFRASLISVDTMHRSADDELLEEVLEVLGWRVDELDPALPPARIFAGAWHLLLALSSKATLDRLHYDFDTLRRIMSAAGLTTLQLVWRERADLFHARNPFPVGGVVEDPATGASAAALAGYLRDAGLMAAPFELTILQGAAIGRPSLIQVRAPSIGGISMSGNAVVLEGAA